MGLLLTAAFGAGKTFAADESACQLNVEPAAAIAGSQFTLSGAGYSPTHLVLESASGRETTIELDLGGADPFEIPIASNVGDEGTWTATVHAEGTDCSARTTFQVTLLSTAGWVEAGWDAVARLPLALYAVVGLLGFGGGALLARQFRLV